MADTFARMRQLQGTTAEWTANDIVIGLGELAVEKIGPVDFRMKLGDGVSTFSALPYFDPGVEDFVKLAGDTMTGPLTVPTLAVTGFATVTRDATISGAARVTGATTLNGGATVNGGSINANGGIYVGTGTPANLADKATCQDPPAADNDFSVPNTRWVQARIFGIITGLMFQGTWDAATNSPPLANGGAGSPPATRGWFYQVAVAGSTALDGNSVWAAGDIAAFNGVAWQRVPRQLAQEQILAGLGYTPVNRAGDDMTGALRITVGNGPALNLVGGNMGLVADASDTSGLIFDKVGWFSIWGSSGPGFDIANYAAPANARVWQTFIKDSDGTYSLGAYNDDYVTLQSEVNVYRDGGIGGRTEPPATSDTRLASTEFVKKSGATASHISQALAAEFLLTNNVATTFISAGPVGAAGEIWMVMVAVNVFHQDATGVTQTYITVKLYADAVELGVATIVPIMPDANAFHTLHGIVTLTGPTTFSADAQPFNRTTAKVNGGGATRLTAMRIG